MFSIVKLPGKTANKLELFKSEITYKSKVKRGVTNINFYIHKELKYSNNFLFVHTEEQKSKKIYIQQA